jgi:D-3-phosphoglycerate dehydrogenase / 2-oxoglutarate reductase
MQILLTTTSFIDTPGLHQKKLYNSKYKIDTLRGPLKEKVLLPIISNYDGIICGDDDISKKVIIKGSKGKLKVISKYGIGLDKIDLNAAKKCDIPVFSTPGVNHITVSEHILALIFTYYKNIHLEHQITQSGKWNRLIGNEVFKKKIGILGLGRIGKELYKRVKAMGMKPLVYDLNIDKKFVSENKVKVSESIEQLVEDIDILSLTLPLSKMSKGIINKKLIEKTKKNIILVNTSRALIVDQKSLIYLLKEKKIKAYLTDVLEEEPMTKHHPLLEFDNVIITPHIGSRTFESVQRQGSMAVENLFKCLKKWQK